jgi:hypothetical protein
VAAAQGNQRKHLVRNGEIEGDKIPQYQNRNPVLRLRKS